MDVCQAVIGSDVQQGLCHVGQFHEGCQVQRRALVVAANVHVGAVGNRHRYCVGVAQQDREPDVTLLGGAYRPVFAARLNAAFRYPIDGWNDRDQAEGKR